MDTRGTNVFKIRNLLAFLSVVKHGGLTRAAKLTNRSQGQLSSIIKDIEDTCGTPLFVRASTGIELNHAGRLFVQKAQNYIDAYYTFLEETKRLAEVENNQIVLYAPPGVINFLAENVVHDFNVKHPEISLIMNSCQSGNHNNYDHLLNDADVIISLQPSSHPDAVNKKFTLDMGFYANPNFPLPNSIKHPQDLLSAQCITIDDYGFGSNSWGYIDENNREVLLNISGKFKCHDSPSAISMASKNLGIIYIPNIIADKHVEMHDITRVLSGFWGQKTYYMIYKKNKYISNAELSFRMFLLNFMKGKCVHL